MKTNRLVEFLEGPDGKLAHLKLWNNIAAALFTAIVIRREWFLPPPDKGVSALSEDLLIWYAGMLIAGVVINKAGTILSNK